MNVSMPLRSMPRSAAGSARRGNAEALQPVVEHDRPITEVAEQHDPDAGEHVLRPLSSPPPSARAVRDVELTEEIRRVHEGQLRRLRGAQGPRRAGPKRPMRGAGLRGISRTKTLRTTRPAQWPATLITWSDGSSCRGAERTLNGPTSPTSAPSPGGSTPPYSLTCSPAAWSAGRCRRRCAPTWPERTQDGLVGSATRTCRHLRAGASLRPRRSLPSIRYFRSARAGRGRASVGSKGDSSNNRHARGVPLAVQSRAGAKRKGPGVALTTSRSTASARSLSRPGVSGDQTC
jgi:hypothetical protein